MIHETVCPSMVMVTQTGSAEGIGVWVGGRSVEAVGTGEYGVGAGAVAVS